MPPEFDHHALIHGGKYDPIKAREYYLKTRHLKGRHKGTVDGPSGNTNTGGTTSADLSGHMRPSRQKELAAEKAALEARLHHLEQVLKNLVSEAKKRAGVVDQSPSSDPKETAAKNEKGKKDTPLTEKQKHDKRVASKKQYDKEKRMHPTQTVQELRQQIRDIRARIEKALADARQAHAASQSNPQTASKGR